MKRELRLGLVSDPCFEIHDTGPGHPERPERLERLRRVFDEGRWTRRCEVVPPERASDERLLRVHTQEHLERVSRACRDGEPYIDSTDCAIGPRSEEIARLAAGSVTALAQRVAGGDLDRGFAAVRPPGHHAERDLAMGFCLYNNVAVAAASLRAEARVGRILIADWDVHHGNGTQHLFEQDPDVFYFSVHQWPLYPGTGGRGETGRGAGKGTTLNCPLPPGSGDDAFLGALRDELAPAMELFRPEFVFISAGFDAHRRDPLASLEVSTGAYGVATRILAEIADRHAAGRIVSALEGGYDLQALGESVALHLEELSS